MRVFVLASAVIASIILEGCGGAPGVAVLFHDYPLGADLPGRPLYRLELDGECLYVRSQEDGRRFAAAWPESTASWDDRRRTLTLDGIEFQDGDLMAIVYGGPGQLLGNARITGPQPQSCDYVQGLTIVWTTQQYHDFPPGFPHKVPDGSVYSDYVLRIQFGGVDAAMKSRVMQEASHSVRDDLRELAPKRVVSLTLEHEPEMHIVATFTGPLDTLPDASNIVAESPLPIEFRSAGD